MVPDRVNVYLLKVYLDFCDFSVPPNLKNEVHLRDQLKLRQQIRDLSTSLNNFGSLKKLQRGAGR